jgi:Tfp pilus assembly protein PilO
MAIGATQKWYAGAGVASVAVLAAGWFLLVSPQQGNAADLGTQADAAIAHNAVTQTQIAGLQKEFANLPQLQSQVAKIRTRIPASPNEAALLRALSDAARTAGVTLSAVRAQPPVAIVATGSAGASAAAGTNPLATPGQVSQIPLSIDIVGGFANTRLFLNAVEGMQREMLVTNLDIKRNESSAGLATTLTARVFLANPGAFVDPNAVTTPASATGAGTDAAS